MNQALTKNATATSARMTARRTFDFDRDATSSGVSTLLEPSLLFVTDVILRSWSQAGSADTRRCLESMVWRW